MARLLEPTDELGLPWDDWVDGRMRVLKKGRDFFRSPGTVREAGENAARRLGKSCRVAPEKYGREVYVWVQLADAEILLGEPCPCGSSDLWRINPQLAECRACGQTLAVIVPRKRAAERAEPAPVKGDEFVQGLLGHRASVKRARRRDARPPETGLAPQKASKDRRRPSKKTRLKFRRAKERERGLRADAGAAKPDLHTLHGFREVRLSPYERTPEVESFCGYGFRGDRPHLLVVEYPLAGGQRDENRHLVHSLPLEAFESFVDVAALSAYEPELMLEPRSRTARAADPSMERPRLDDFSDVFLAFHSRGPKGERFYGHGKTQDGDTVLLLVEYRLSEGRRIPDPDRPGHPLYGIYWVPLAPFTGLVDQKRLFGDVRVPQPSGMEISSG